jgi:HEPN domain-containing protein
MSDDLSRYISQWLEKANHDLSNARLVIEHNHEILDTALFHIQQAIEKSLKGLLFHYKQDFQRSHDLVYLKELCSKHTLVFSEFDFRKINEFAVAIRYPGEEVHLSKEIAADYLTIAESVFNTVTQIVREN